MPLDINAPEVADRLRRFFRVTGRIPTKLDETIVPVSLVGDISRPPFRLRAGNGTGAFSVVGGGGLTSYGAIAHPAELKGATLVSQIILRNTNAAACTFGINMISAGYVTGQLSTDFLADTEHNAPPATALSQPGRLPVVIRTGRDFPLPGLEIAAITLLPSTSLVLPCEYTLTPGWQLLIWAATVDAALTAYVNATYFPE